MEPTSDHLAAAKLLVQEDYRAKTWIVLVCVESKPRIVGVWDIPLLNKHVSELIDRFGEAFCRRVISFDSMDYAAYRVGLNVAQNRMDAAQAVRDIMANEIR